MGLKLTNAADYAVRAMIHLACLPDGARALRDDIAKAQDIPSSFMAKILRSLVRAQLLRSSRGVNGGFALARPGSGITMLEIVEAVEGPLCLANCACEPTRCNQACDCPAAPVWKAVQEAAKEILASATLENLVSTPRHQGRVSHVPHLAVAGEPTGQDMPS
jgi:Rrf2 family protein